MEVDSTVKSMRRALPCIETTCLLFILAVLVSLLGGEVMYGYEASDAPEAAVAPELSRVNEFSEILFVKRKPFSSDHYYTDIDNGTSPDRFLPDNGIYALDLRTGKERAVVRAADMPGGRGVIGKISLSFDAKSVVFDFRETPFSGFRIWEVNVDGSGLRQISFPPEDEEAKMARWGKPRPTDDIHPAYLPDGGIIFSSTRCEHTILCGGSALLAVPVLHKMRPDGTQIEQLSRSPVSEFCPVMLNDGRVMYHRWEYVDKGSRVSKTIWTMYPDGSGTHELHGASDDTTTVYMYPQPIPGDPERIVCVGTSHYPQGGCLGPILIVNLRIGERERGPDPNEPSYVQWDENHAVTNITPDVFIERRTYAGWHFRQPDGNYVQDEEGQSGVLYTHPFPVSSHEFLVSSKINPQDHYRDIPNAFALYLLDTKGTRKLLHKDNDLSLWHPVPVAARPVPQQSEPLRVEKYAKEGQALCILADVYQGLDGVERGAIKWLRINEAVPRNWDSGKRWDVTFDSSSWKASLWPRVQWGVVPVEEDGSACFTVPADRNIFLQALDKDFREIQRERTYVNYRPGEVRSCTGCHGRTGQAGNTMGKESLMALSRSPSQPQPQPCDLKENGGNGKAQQVIHYPTDIQPIFDRHCTGCHGKENPAGGLSLSGELTQYYCASYEELASKELAGPLISEFISFTKGDQGNYNGAILAPFSLGSHPSRLAAVLRNRDDASNAHTDHTALLNPFEMMILDRWMDSNYQFYGTYYGRHHGKWASADTASEIYDPADFRRRPTFEESISMRAPEWHK